MSQTTERAFEAYVETVLLCRGGWQAGTTAEWDPQRALFPSQVVAFRQETQPKLWAEMGALHGEGLEPMIVAALVKELEVKGSLHVLRHGFKFYGKTFRLAYFKPAHGLNDEVLALYAKNRLTVTRQVPCHPGDHSTVDLVFALNGLPVATCELKNLGTGQSWRHAVKQYQEDRDPRAPLFDFKKRALVHFAADPDEIHMTTRLGRERTHFLPFNRGSHPGAILCGAGNPRHESGHRTGYFWEEVLERESFLDILGHFLFLEKQEEKVDDGKGGACWVTKETLIFPRYHQLDAVRKLVGTARNEGAGESYGVKSPTSVGTGKAEDQKMPLSEIIEVLNERFGTNFTDEDRFFFEQIKEKAAHHPHVIQLRQANPFDKFQLGLRKLIEDMMIQRMSENDGIVTRYMDDKDFERAAFTVLSKVIYEAIPAEKEIVP